MWTTAACWCCAIRAAPRAATAACSCAACRRCRPRARWGTCRNSSRPSPLVTPPPSCGMMHAAEILDAHAQVLGIPLGQRLRVARFEEDAAETDHLRHGPFLLLPACIIPQLGGVF